MIAIIVIIALVHYVIENACVYTLYRIQFPFWKNHRAREEFKFKKIAAIIGMCIDATRRVYISPKALGC